MAAHAALTGESLRLAVQLHLEGGGHDRVKVGNQHYAVARVAVSGPTELASAEDEREWFFRAGSAEIEHVFLPASLRQKRHAVQARYGVDAEVSDLDGREWFDSFADGVAPSPEELGCGACPKPNPGPGEYPLCCMCWNRACKGVLFPKADGSRWVLTPFGYR